MKHKYPNMTSRGLTDLRLQMMVQTGKIAHNDAAEMWEKLKMQEGLQPSLQVKILDLYFKNQNEKNGTRG